MNDDTLLTNDMRRLVAPAALEARTFADLEAAETSLAAEWLGLFTHRPLASLAWTVAAGAILVLTTPLGGLPLELLKQLANAG